MTLKSVFAAGFIGLASGLILGLIGPRACTVRQAPMPTGDGTISRVTVTPTAPVQALDKHQLREMKIIPKTVEQDPDTAVLATGKVEDASGRRTVTAQMDLKQGTTQIVENRRLAEFMNRWEVGGGYGLVEGDTAKGLQVRWTFGRVWELYGSAQVEVFDVDRPENRHPWNAMLWGTMRF